MCALLQTHHHHHASAPPAAIARSKCSPAFSVCDELEHRNNAHFAIAIHPTPGRSGGRREARQLRLGSLPAVWWLWAVSFSCLPDFPSRL